MFTVRSLLAAIFVALLLADASAAPLVEKYLLEGELIEGESALQEHLKKEPNDPEARAGLGVIEFLQAFEHLGASLYKHGLRTERAFRGAPPEFRKLLKQNPDSQPLGYDQWRSIVQTFVDDLKRAESTLAKVNDKDVKLPLHVALIQIDLLGTGHPLNARDLLTRVPLANADEGSLSELVVGFDRGDVCWLRGYCHFLNALGEMLLALDAKEHFDRTAHLFFEKVESPHKYLQEEPRSLDGVIQFDSRVISDIIAYIHLLRFPVKEPERLKAALQHLEAMMPLAKEMWTHYLAESDDDNEWIPNPKQTGVLRVAVSQEMVDTWLATLAQLDGVLHGKRLIPFWRGTEAKRGVNLRRAFMESRELDPILWIQGTAATPFLEEGELTELADPRTLTRISDNFGGLQFFGFAFWFQ